MINSNGHGFQEPTHEDIIKMWQVEHLQRQSWLVSQISKKEYQIQKMNATIVEPLKETVSE